MIPNCVVKNGTIHQVICTRMDTAKEIIAPSFMAHASYTLQCIPNFLVLLAIHVFVPIILI